MLPDWMKEQTEFTPKKDRNGFLTKNLLSFLKLFRHFRMTKNETVSTLKAGLRLLLVLGIIILTALSQNLIFCGAVAAGFLLYLSFSKIQVLQQSLSTAIAASLFTALIMVPSFIIYKSNSIIFITLKVFLSTGILSLYANITPWNKITAALRFVKIPDFIIFLLDLTIHYILILGNIAFEMLMALKLRSVGKNTNKHNSFSGILGTVFLKSVEAAKESQQAIECRLFSGNYVTYKAKESIKDILPIFVLIFYIALYVSVL